MDVCSEYGIVSHIWQHLECRVSCEEIFLDASVT